MFKLKPTMAPTPISKILDELTGRIPEAELVAISHERDGLFAQRRVRSGTSVELPFAELELRRQRLHETKEFFGPLVAQELELKEMVAFLEPISAEFSLLVLLPRERDRSRARFWLRSAARRLKAFTGEGRD